MVPVSKMTDEERWKALFQWLEDRVAQKQKAMAQGTAQVQVDHAENL